MLMHQIALVSRSRSVDFPTLSRVASALNLQLVRDLAPIWGVAAVVRAMPSADHLDPGLWPIFVVDDLEAGNAGFHLTSHNQPYAQVVAGSTWSLAASHEALEMAVDPSGNRLVAAPAIKVSGIETMDTAATVEYLVEVCGPSVDPASAYLIDGILVADFCTPHYFDPTGVGGARFAFSGRIKRPRQVLPGGMLTWFDPSTNKLHRLQHRGTPEIVDLRIKADDASVTGGLSLRAFADRQARPVVSLSALPGTDKTVERRADVLTFLARSGPMRANLFGSVFKSQSPAPLATNAGRRATDIPTGATAAPGTAPEFRTGDRRKANSYERVRTAIFANVAALTLPGILSVRPGLHFGPDGFTNERVVVVKARPNAIASLGDAIPATYGDIRVEVRPADPLERLRARNGATYLQVAAARHELRAPVFDDALYLDGSGTTVDDATVAAATMGAMVAKRHIDYSPPSGVSLDPVAESVTLLLHVSPDAGWSQLQGFLSANRGNLVVGMHDFTAGHVLAALRSAVAGRQLTMTLDRPAPPAVSDQSGEDAKLSLAQHVGSGFRGAWALTNANPRAPVWIYPNAYKVKLAVRDDDCFWLSSANWNRGNLPEIDLANVAAAGEVAAVSERDWHVIATSKPLADTFRAFLAHDHAVASAEENKTATTSVAASGPSTVLPPVATEAFTTGRAPKQFFQPKTITVTASVQPLLTPDNYQPLIRALIESATTSFFFQTQYIHPSGKRGDEAFDALIGAISQLVEKGVDVKIITSAYQTDDWMEKLVMKGIPSALVRRQPGVHNNGMIVDHKSVLVSGQSWSADGALRNRDAGLIIHEAQAAAYFEQVFLHDWEHLAMAVTGAEG